ncbi:Zuotin, partial [Hypsizygus marmoreus]
WLRRPTVNTLQSEDREFKSLWDRLFLLSSLKPLHNRQQHHRKKLPSASSFSNISISKMATVLTLPITVPALPKSYVAPAASSSSRLSPPHPTGHRTLLPVGPAHLNYLRLALHHKHDFESFDAYLEAERVAKEKLLGAENGAEDDLGVGEEEEADELLSLDPKEWKKQDHYAVLGLSKFRYLATADQIKIAHRKKVLKHHPDKKASTETPSSILGIQNTNDDAFFKCIQKAHEVLTNAEKRRQFDSVDPAFIEAEEDLTTITEKEFKAKKLDFFKTFKPIFELYKRFSRVQPVPGLGALDATKEEVEGFYDFWYNFDSWRSFEWLDKEVNEGSDSRDDKRYTEKKNKSERARRKKEDIAKLRGLVDLTLSLDPRIKLIKQQEKEAREAKKAATNGKPAKKTKAQEEEEKKKKAEEEKQKEEAEKAARAEAKKAKAAAANAAKKARRQQRAVEDGA